MSQGRLSKIVLQALMKSLIGTGRFRQFYFHMFNQEAHINRVVLLMGSIVEKYLQVRYYYAAKKYFLNLKEKHGCRVRQAMD